MTGPLAERPTTSPLRTVVDAVQGGDLPRGHGSPLTEAELFSAYGVEVTLTLVEARDLVIAARRAGDQGTVLQRLAVVLSEALER